MDRINSLVTVPQITVQNDPVLVSQPTTQTNTGFDTYSKAISKASPKLFESCAKGTHFKEVTIE